MFKEKKKRGPGLQDMLRAEEQAIDWRRGGGREKLEGGLEGVLESRPKKGKWKWAQSQEPDEGGQKMQQGPRAPQGGGERGLRRGVGPRGASQSLCLGLRTL